MRFSWVGGTSGWTTYTSVCRQLARNCTCMQSLLKRVVRDGESGTSSSEQTSSANARWACPEKTVMRSATGSG